MPAVAANIDKLCGAFVSGRASNFPLVRLSCFLSFRWLKVLHIVRRFWGLSMSRYKRRAGGASAAAVGLPLVDGRIYKVSPCWFQPTEESVCRTPKEGRVMRDQQTVCCY